MSRVYLDMRVPVASALVLLLLAGCAAPDQAPAPAASGPPSSARVIHTTEPPSRPPGPPASPVPPGDPPQIYFSLVTWPGSPDPAIEITAVAQIDRLQIQPPEAAAAARDAITARLAPGTRIFVFTLNGCQNPGAVLQITTTRIIAGLIDVDVECMVAEAFLAVFAVPAAQIPPGARLP
jgi:hypothetical protein